ncbi:MAG: DUF4230 domain-containing protein, partial [Anaerolineaceae bacterium]|nr:DUF4230 domain-containing protein [Anaerolineaceae bacterium]
MSMIIRILTKPPVLLLLALILAVGSGFFLYRSESIGSGIGAGAGKMTGLAVGSYKGVTDGLERGAEAGKEAGLSAEDMTMDISQTVREVGNLEVLVANVEIPDYHEVGNKYAALYMFRGSAVFSIDLSAASISRTNEGEILIVLPEPSAVVRINDSETELLAEYQRKFFNGSADDGFDAYLNTLRMIDSISPDKVSNYDVLMEIARSSAKKQVEMLAKSVCAGKCGQITILF